MLTQDLRRVILAVRDSDSARIISKLLSPTWRVSWSTWVRVIGPSMMKKPVDNEEFTIFVQEVEPRLSLALAAAYGVDVGRDSAADALLYAWEHWIEVQVMKNPAGFLYRVGQSAARRYRRGTPLFPAVDRRELPRVEPALPAALLSLSEAQRTAVVLVHVLEWTEREAADLLGVDRSTIRRHRDRGLAKLRTALEVTADA